MRSENGRTNTAEENAGRQGRKKGPLLGCCEIPGYVLNLLSSLYHKNAAHMGSIFIWRRGQMISGVPAGNSWKF